MSRSQCRFSSISCMFYTFIPMWKWKLLSRVWLFVTPMDYTVHGILQARILEWVAFPYSTGSSWPRVWTQVEPKNTGVGSLSLFQWSFPTQESNQGLLHCRWILYQLSYQEAPYPHRHSHANDFSLTSDVKANPQNFTV